jgi:hypothetical protein
MATASGLRSSSDLPIDPGETQWALTLLDTLAAAGDFFK